MEDNNERNLQFQPISAPSSEEDQENDSKRSTKRREFKGGLKKAIAIITTVMSIYQIGCVIYTINPLQQRAIHLLFVLVLIFMLYPATKKSPRNRVSVVDCTMILGACVTIGYLLIRFKSLAAAAGRYNMTDIVMGAVVVFLVIEACRRTVGNALPILAIIVLLYGFFGKYLSGPLAHSGFSFKRIIAQLTLTTGGIYGQILGVSSTYIYLFILFGAFLGVTGMSSVFNDLATALAGGQRGGPAKVSVLASGLMGSISGSTTANVVTTGAFTIPLMKKTGYKDYFAASVESAASAGGQIMPPVMGSAAFLMADSLGVPYAAILKAALLPAILYYLSLWVMIDLRARKDNIRGLPKESLPKIGKIIKERGHLLLPLLVIIYLLVAGYSATYAALYGIIISIVSSFLRRSTRINPKELLIAMQKGALSALSVAIACALIGIIIGVISLTGAILAVGNAIFSLSGGVMITSLVLTMLVSLILGMGLPTTACYVLTSTVAAPVLTNFGVTLLQAHMFVFYFGILSTITPPVAAGSYAAAGIAGANPNKTGINGIILAIAGFIIPFMFIYSPELLLPSGIGFMVTIRVIITSLIGVVCLALCAQGHFYRDLTVIERIFSAAAALLLIDSKTTTDVIGLAVFICIMLLQYRSKKRFAA